MAKVSSEEDRKMCLKVPSCGYECREFTDMEHACVRDDGHPGQQHECICGFKFQDAPPAAQYIGRAC